MKYLKVISLAAWAVGLVACSDDGSKLQGYVEGRYIYASSYASGYLEQLPVHRGELVKQGQPLFVLSQEPETDDLAQATANAKAQQQTLVDLKLGGRPSEVEASQDKVKAAAANAEYAKKMYGRNEQLYKKHVIGSATLDSYRKTYLRDIAILKQAKADLKTATIGARKNQQMAQSEHVKAAQAVAKKAAWVLSTKAYKAPKAGQVTETFYRPGEYIRAGQPVLSVLVPSEVKLIFYVPERKLAALQVGEAVQFKCDGCKSSSAKIDFIASRAEYTPPVLYTQSARKNLVYRVEAAVPKAVALTYHPGEPVDIRLPRQKKAREK
jgi:HlyD family secretion protein